MGNDARAWSRSAWIGLVLGASLLGCSETVPPDPPPTLTGTVLTSDSLAVEGASILVSYLPSFPDLLEPRTATLPRGMRSLLDPATLDPDSVKWMGITDLCGDTIRVLCEEPCTDATLSWDGRDDDGLRVTEGFYSVWLVLPDTTLSSELFVLSGYEGWNPATGRAHARTDAEGRFSLTDECLGFGKTIDDANGAVAWTISRVIDLHAVHPDGRQARLEALTFPEAGTLEVNPVIPD